MFNFLTRVRTEQIRSKFTFSDKSVMHWFPGHMSRAIKDMEQKLRQVDCILEVHDARIPWSGRSPKFKYSMRGNPHILILNKADLADIPDREKLKEELMKDDLSDVIFTSCKKQSCIGLNEIVPTLVREVKKSRRRNRASAPEHCALVIGVPNVGKSSVINAMRNRHLKKSKATAVGAIAGVTKRVSNKIKISQDPLIYLIDSPGVLFPNVGDIETGFKLALVSCLQDHLVGLNNISDFLLNFLHSTGNYTYVEYFGLPIPPENIMELLFGLAVKEGKTLRRRTVDGRYVLCPDVEYAARRFISAFREGQFGKVLLDKI